MEDPRENGQFQGNLLGQIAAQNRAEQAFENLQKRVQEEALRRQRWIETQIWTTDYSEVAVLDVVTFGESGMHMGAGSDIKAYRYPTAEEAPDDEGYYSDESGLVTEVQRVTRDEFLRIVEENEVEPPEYIPNAEVWDGDLGAGEGSELPEEESDT